MSTISVAIQICIAPFRDCYSTALKGTIESIMPVTLVTLFSASAFPILPEIHETVGGFKAPLRITPGLTFSGLGQPNSLSSFKVNSGTYKEK